MKKKKIDYNRPALFYQDGRNDYTVENGPRVRIFYPSGDAEWSTLTNVFGGVSCFEFSGPPCWLHGEWTGAPQNMREAVARANDFDRRCGFCKMEFLGNL